MATKSLRRYFLIIAAHIFCLFTFLCFSYKVVGEPLLPVLPIEAKSIDEVLLGKKLFHSVLLSRDNTISCASCHAIAEGGDDGLVASVGVNQQIGPINAPTVLNSALNAFQFWDGRAATLEEQVEGPIHNPLEMGSNWHEVINKLKADSELVADFNRLYPSGLNEKSVAQAIAAYERQLLSMNAPFDQYLQGQLDAIDQQEKDGYQLFKQMGCISCHQGRNVGGNMFQYFGVMGDYFKERGNITQADYGRYNVTEKEEDRYKFKVPSLRNVALTAPYFHDGSAATLDEAIRVMAKYQLGRPISEQQVESLRVFLHSLTGHVDETLK